MDNNSLLIIKKNYLSFSDVERRIADYILAHPQKVIHTTTHRLAGLTGVSEGSVIKFANKLGFDGFTKLKINIAQNLSQNSAFVFDNVTDGDTPKAALRKMTENAAAAFRSTYEILPPRDLERAVEMIQAARRIELYGVGTSSMVANDAYYRLMRIGLPVYAVTDAHICSVSASLLDGDCLALGISHSGRTVETLRAMEIAKARQAKTICLTSYADSPLAGLCDISLITVSKESEENREAVVSRLTQLLLLDSICSYISCQRKDVTVKLIENVIDIIDEHRKS